MGTRRGRTPATASRGQADVGQFPGGVDGLPLLADGQPGHPGQVLVHEDEQTTRPIM